MLMSLLLALSSGDAGGRGDSMHKIVPGDQQVPAIIVTTSERRYSVSGSDIGELREALRWDSLRDAAGGGHALTHGSIEVSYDFEQTRAGCRMVLAQVFLHVSTTLPTWEPQRTVSSELRKRWENMYRALLSHEAVHAQHAREAAEEVRRDLAKLPSEAASCRAIESLAQRNLYRIVARLRFRDQRFDMRTRNGIKQGAVL